jgi:hypothetical protein
MPADNDAPTARLRRYFDEAVSTSIWGGASVIEEIVKLSVDCILGADERGDAVAFGLGAFLYDHAKDMDERPVTTAEAYAFSAAALDHVSDAIAFIENGGSADEAIRIIAALAQISPSRFYRPLR